LLGSSSEHDKLSTGHEQLELHADGAKGGGTEMTPSRRRTATRGGPQRTASVGTGLDQGAELEMRLARVMFWEGSYTKQGIDLQRHFGTDPLTVTDIDVLSYAISPQLRGLKTICEAKSGTSKSAPSPLDRTIWLMGVMKLVQAESAELVTAKVPKEEVRALAASVNVRAFRLDELVIRERAAQIDLVQEVGSHGVHAAQTIKLAHQRFKVEPALERAYWFLRSEVWFLDDWAAVKRTLGLLRNIRKWWTPGLEDADMTALRWLYSEAVSVFVLRLVLLLREGLTRDSASWASFVRDKLAEGAVPIHQMRKLSEGVDSFVAKIMTQFAADIESRTQAMGAFLPQPPEWADEFAELTARLMTMPQISGAPRYVDALLHQSLVRQQELDEKARVLLNIGSRDGLGLIRRSIAAFLRGAVDLPDEVDRALSLDFS
jgi:hypothetical protein